MNSGARGILAGAAGLGLLLLVGCGGDGLGQSSDSDFEALGEPLEHDGPDVPDGCGEERSLVGTVDWAPVALPAGTTLTVQIRDTSYQDVSSTLIAEQVILDPGQGPVEFEIRYDRCHIQDDHTYTMHGAINGPAGHLFFANDTAYDVLTQGNPDTVELPLVQVTPPDTVENT